MVISIQAKSTMRTVPAGEFKAKCLALMDEVKATGQTVIVTKRGKPVAWLTPPRDVPVEPLTADSIFGSLRGFVCESGQTIEPDESFIPFEEWEGLREDWSAFPRK